MKNNKKKNSFEKLNSKSVKTVKVIDLDKIKGGKATYMWIIEDDLIG